MKKYIFLFVFTLSTCISFGQDWKQFTSEEFNFSADFPTPPEKTVQSVPTAVGDIDMNMFMSTNTSTSNLIYSIISSSYPLEAFKDATDEYNNTVLDGAVNGAVTNVNGELVFDNKVTFQGYPGRSFKIKITGNFLYINAYLVKNTMMICQVICSTKNDKNDDIKRFFDSFKILKTENKK